MKYIKQFNNETAYNTAKSGGDFDLPSVSLIKDNYEVRYDNLNPTPQLDYFYVENAYNGTNNIKFTIYWSEEEYTVPNFSYSFDKETWYGYTIDTDITLSINQKVYFRGNNESINSIYYGETVLSASNEVNLGGWIGSLASESFEPINIPSLESIFMDVPVVDASNLDLSTYITLTEYSYAYIFSGCSSLIAAPEIPILNLANRCYSDMFKDCTSLTEAPELPATTLANYCYSGMFEGCTSLTVSPELHAITLANYCYSRMFKDCTSLTEAPELPATTLAIQCYEFMFQGCISLTDMPELPAINLTKQCYINMFYGCTNIKVAIEQDAVYTKPYRIPSSGNGVISEQSLEYMLGGTGGTFTGTPNINTTYYLNISN